MIINAPAGPQTSASVASLTVEPSGGRGSADYGPRGAGLIFEAG
ncbi:MAG TPA: hypothetical protein VMY40_13070 [Anaerolineae bacterium]|nr:hypothetical protein [Anaerolineae bacterium]